MHRGEASTWVHSWIKPAAPWRLKRRVSIGASAGIRASSLASKGRRSLFPNRCSTPRTALSATAAGGVKISGYQRCAVAQW